MTEYLLANGATLNDEEIERECSEYESGTWRGRLDNIRVGRPQSNTEPLIPITIKMPVSMVAAVDMASENRADFIRHAIAAAL